MSNYDDDEICHLDEIIIQGKTIDGKKFRPSDWVDRLCGMLASFDLQKVEYSPYLRPLVYKNMNCVALRKSLKEIKPNLFNFIIQFANDNKLIIVDCAEFKDQIQNDEKTTK